MQYKTKVIQTGCEIEITRYSKDVRRGSSVRARRNTRKSKMREKMSEHEREERSRASLKNSLSRTKTNLRRKINCNLECDKFLMFTFNTEIYDINISSPIFTKFIQRMNYRYKNLKYIAVPEFMPKSGRVHYHMLVNLPYLKKSELENIWGNGFVGIKKTYSIKNLGGYMSKYLTKENFDERYKHKRKILYSENCNSSKEAYGSYAEAVYDNVLKTNAEPVYRMEFKENEYVGKAVYEVYNLSDLPIEMKPVFDNPPVRAEKRNLKQSKLEI